MQLRDEFVRYMVPRCILTIYLELHDFWGVTSTAALQTSLNLKMSTEWNGWWCLMADGREFTGSRLDEVSRRKKNLIRAERRCALKDFPAKTGMGRNRTNKLSVSCYEHTHSYSYRVVASGSSVHFDFYPCWHLCCPQWTATLVKVIRQM